MTINNRIGEVMKFYGLNKNQLSIKLGVHPTVVHNIIDPKGRGNFPSYEFIGKLLSSFEDINGDWLLTGRGAMLMQASIEINNEPKNYPIINTSDSQVNETLEKFKKSHTGTKKIAIIKQPKAANYLKHLNDPEFINSLPYLTLPDDFLKKAQLRCFEAKGDMGATISDKDWVIAAYCNQPYHIEDTHAYIVVTQESILITRVKGIDPKHGLYLAYSNNQNYNGQKININDIKELWEAKALICFSVHDSPQELSTKLSRIETQLSELKKEIELLKLDM